MARSLEESCVSEQLMFQGRRRRAKASDSNVEVLPGSVDAGTVGMDWGSCLTVSAAPRFRDEQKGEC